MGDCHGQCEANASAARTRLQTRKTPAVTPSDSLPLSNRPLRVVKRTKRTNPQSREGVCHRLELSDHLQNDGTTSSGVNVGSGNGTLSEVSTDIAALSPDDLRSIFAKVPFLYRRDVVPLVCKSWATICSDTPALWEHVEINAAHVQARQKRQLSWKAALAWVDRWPKVKSLDIWLQPFGAIEGPLKDWPPGCLSSIIPKVASLTTLAFYCRGGYMEGRDFLHLSRLQHLRSLRIDATMRPETLIEGLPHLQSLTGLTSLGIHAATPPPRPQEPVWIAPCPSTEVVEGPSHGGAIMAGLPLKFGRFSHLLSLSVSADANMLRLDGLPNTALTCVNLTSLRLGGCFEDCYTLPRGIDALSSLVSLELEGWKLWDLYAEISNDEERRIRVTVLEGIEQLTSLRRLALRGCHLRPDAIMEIAELAPLLQVLDLSDNPRLFNVEEHICAAVGGAKGAAAIATFADRAHTMSQTVFRLAVVSPSLQKLDISGCMLNDGGIFEVLFRAALGAVAKRHPLPTVISL